MKSFNQTDLASPRTFQKSIMGLIIAFICALLAAGCSSSGGGGFVASPDGGGFGGGGTGNAGNGSVTFNFVRAQTNPIVVPTTTTDLRFEFFSGLEGNGTIVKSETHAYQDTITIENVPSSARSTKVTAYTTEGFPVAEFTANVNVQADETVLVEASSGSVKPITVEAIQSSPTSLNLAVGASKQLAIRATFSNGDSVPLTGGLTSLLDFDSNALNIATVTPDGTVTGVANGSTVINVQFQRGGAPLTIPVAVGNGVVTPPAVTALELEAVEGPNFNRAQGTASQPMTVTATNDLGVQTIVTGADGVTFSSSDSTGKITVSSGGVIQVANDAPIGLVATIRATYQGQASNPITVTVIDAVLQSVVVSPQSVSLPFGGFEQQISVMGVFSNGDSLPVLASNTTFTPSSTGLFTIDESSDLLTTALYNASLSAGTTSVAVDVTINTESASGSLDVTVGDIAVTSLVATPMPDPTATPISLTIGQVQEFRVEAILSDSNNTVVDVSDFGSLQLTAVQGASSADPNIVVNGSQVVAVNATSAGNPAQAVFTIIGAGPNGANAMTNLNIIVLREVLTDINIFFGGLKVLPSGNVDPNDGSGALAVNLPRGYVGVVEVVGTFNTGLTRKLEVSEYDLTLGPLVGNYSDAIQLLLPGYSTAGIHPRYIDGQASEFATTPYQTAAFDAPDAVIDDLYGGIRNVVNIVGSGLRGSNGSTVVVRDTFRAVVADWRRGVGHGGTFDKTGVPVSADGTRFTAPGATRNVSVVLSPSVEDAANPIRDLDKTFSVTVSDPQLVTFNSAKFVNYEDDSRVPVGTVRELEVLVDFSAVTVTDTNEEETNPPSYGPFVDGVVGFKLAEANVALASNRGGANEFAFQTPTDLGFIGVTSEFPVDVNQVTAYVGSFAGFVGERPLATLGPELDTVPTPNVYKPATYTQITRVFGPSFSIGTSELAEEYVVSRDPGPALPDAEARAGRAPDDVVVLEVATINAGRPITFANPTLFSIDPINPSGTAIEIGVGASRLFQTRLSFDESKPAKNRSLDYLPTLVTGTGTPGFVGVREKGETGRLRVSAIDINGDIVTGADVTTQTGYVALQSATPVANAITSGVQGMVIALDAVGNPINVFPKSGTITDTAGTIGAPQSVTTLDVAP